MPFTQQQRGLLGFNQYTPDYIGQPINAIANMAKANYDNNKQILDKTNALDIAISNLNVNNLDNPLIQEQKQKFDEGIKSIAQDNEYGLIQARVNNLYKDYATNKALSSAVARNQDYIKYRDTLDKLYRNNKIADYAYNKGMAIPFTPTKANLDGYYSNEFEGKINFANKFDYDTYLEKLTSGWRADGSKDSPKLVSGTIPDVNTGQNINYSYWVKNGKKIDKNEVSESVMKSLLNNPDAIAYAKDNIAHNPEFEGKNIKDVFKSWADAHINRTSYEASKNYSGFNVDKTSSGNDDYSSFISDFYGLSNLYDKKDDKHLLDYLNPKNTKFDTTKSSKKSLHIVAGLSPSNFIGAKNSQEVSYKPYYKNITNKKDLQRLNGLAFGIGGMDKIVDKNNNPINNVNQLTNEQKKDVYAKIKNFIDKQSNPETKAILTVPFMKAYDNKEATYLTEQFTGNKKGEIKNSQGEFIAPGLLEGFTKFVDANTKEIISMDELLDELPNSARMRVVGNTNWSNPITFETGDQQFANSKVLVFSRKSGGKPIVVYAAMPLGNAQWKYRADVDKNKILKAYYDDGEKSYVTDRFGNNHAILYKDDIFYIDDKPAIDINNRAYGVEDIYNFINREQQ